VADIPGLIEGAHEGTGLGLEFLRHVERTKLLVHVIDVSSTGRDPVDDFLTISREIQLYRPSLLGKPQVVAASKMDAVDDPSRVERLREFCAKRGLEMFEISAVSGSGIDKFIQSVDLKLKEVQKTSEVAIS